MSLYKEIISYKCSVSIDLLMAELIQCSDIISKVTDKDRKETEKKLEQLSVLGDDVVTILTKDVEKFQIGAELNRVLDSQGIDFFEYNFDNFLKVLSDSIERASDKEYSFFNTVAGFVLLVLQEENFYKRLEKEIKDNGFNEGVRGFLFSDIKLLSLNMLTIQIYAARNQTRKTLEREAIVSAYVAYLEAAMITNFVISFKTRNLVHQAESRAADLEKKFKSNSTGIDLEKRFYRSLRLV